jgi:hypothetical protein
LYVTVTVTVAVRSFAPHQDPQHRAQLYTIHSFIPFLSTDYRQCFLQVETCSNLHPSRYIFDPEPLEVRENPAQTPWSIPRALKNNKIKFSVLVHANFNSKNPISFYRSFCFAQNLTKNSNGGIRRNDVYLSNGAGQSFRALLQSISVTRTARLMTQ